MSDGRYAMMDDEEEEALFARLRRGLELLRRDAETTQPNRPAGPSAPDREAMAALARVEASLRTLAFNVEALARRADGLDAAIETRIESTVARTTAGMRAEIERLSSRVAGFAGRPEPARITAPSSQAARGSRLGSSRRIAPILLVLILLAGAFAAWRAFGIDASPYGQSIARWAGWRAPTSPDASPPAASATTQTTATPRRR